MSLADVDPCVVTDPRVVTRDACVDAVLSRLRTLLPPADDASQKPGALVVGGVGPAAVPLARVLLFVQVARAEHKAGDVVRAAGFTLGAFYVGDRQLLQLGGFGADKPQPPPAAHDGAAGVPQQVLCEVLGAQADGAPLVGHLYWTGELQQRDVVVVRRPPSVVVRVDDLLCHRVVSL